MRVLWRRTRERIEAGGSIADVVQELGPDGPIAVLSDWRWVVTPGTRRVTSLSSGPPTA